MTKDTRKGAPVHSSDAIANATEGPAFGAMRRRDPLIEAAVRGDRAAFAQVLDDHYDFIYRTALKWSGRVSDAEDIAQDVCVRLATALKSFDGRASFTTWLYRIVLNAANDTYRRKKRNDKRVAALALVAEEQAPPEQETALMADEIWRAVRELPEKQRDAVLLVYAEEKTHAEAAHIMQVKEGTVSWYLSEAKNTLRGTL